MNPCSVSQGISKIESIPTREAVMGATLVLVIISYCPDDRTFTAELERL